MRLFECGSLVPGCEWHTRANDDAEVVRRAVEHLRATHGETMIRESMVEHIKERIVDEKAAVIRAWAKAGKIAKCDPYHLIFSIWSTTQHYADFDVQVRAVLGQDQSGEGRFEDAARFLEQLFVTGLDISEEPA